MSSGTAGDRAAWALRWAPALVVALGAAVATAHGLFEVAVAARVPSGIAWLYPLITDGLAMVAYAATARLAGRAAGYAWSVVVLTAALSGLAQAAYLTAGALQADVVVRFGVGAWPAVAIALVAHLLHLLAGASDDAPVQTEERPAEADVEPSALEPVREGLASTELVASEPSDEQPEQPQPEDDTESEADPRVVALARRCAAGEQLTGPSVAAEHEVSDRTGRRLLDRARAHLEARPELAAENATSPAHLGLHLVEQTPAGGIA